MSEPAACQCTRCRRYLTKNRTEFSWQICEACARELGKVYKMLYSEGEIVEGIPLAELRGTLSDPKLIEGLALLAEECAEVQQRIMKIMRWGMDADFQGTTQTHKLHMEIADVLCVVALLKVNRIIDMDEITRMAQDKLNKFQEDAAGPRQRLLHLEVP